MINDVISSEKGKKVLLLGNEAIARGALEGKVDVVSAYPGTPSSEIADTLSMACKMLKGKMDFHMEYSTNEKVAVEVGIGASLAGKRSIVTMKHVGVNVASDALFSFAYVGARGGFILVSADDPSMHSSQNEQDNRWYGRSAGIPVIEPSTVQEAKDFTKELFEISEKFKIPVMLRTCTRLNHSRGIVTLGELPEKTYTKNEWVSSPETDVVLPAHARKLKLKLQKKLESLANFFSSSSFNKIYNPDSNSEVGIIACGHNCGYVLDSLSNLNVKLPVLKISTTYPIPLKLIKKFSDNLNRILIVEEVDPFLELHLRAELDGVSIHGKIDGYIPLSFENNVARVETAIAKLLGIKTKVNYDEIERKYENIIKKIPPRPPIFCPGCPHAAVFYVIRKIANEYNVKFAFPSDIGCYTLGINPPFRAVDITFCMGASIGISCGLSYAIDNPIVATIGDSTFLHAGIPALINAVYNKRKFVLIILDNQTTGMTGHQPHPGTGIRGCGETGVKIKIEDVVKGVGVKFVEVVNAYNIKKLEDILRRALKREDVSVIIARQPCAIITRKELKKRGVKLKSYRILKDLCNKCLKCVKDFSCPAIYIEDSGYPKINPNLCVSCGVCSKICPHGAIVK